MVSRGVKIFRQLWTWRVGKALARLRLIQKLPPKTRTPILSIGLTLTVVTPVLLITNYQINEVKATDEYKELEEGHKVGKYLTKSEQIWINPGQK